MTPEVAIAVARIDIQLMKVYGWSNQDIYDLQLELFPEFTICD